MKKTTRVMKSKRLSSLVPSSEKRKVRRAISPSQPSKIETNWNSSPAAIVFAVAAAADQPAAGQPQRQVGHRDLGRPHPQADEQPADGPGNMAVQVARKKTVAGLAQGTPQQAPRPCGGRRGIDRDPGMTRDRQRCAGGEQGTRFPGSAGRCRRARRRGNSPARQTASPEKRSPGRGSLSPGVKSRLCSAGRSWSRRARAVVKTTDPSRSRKGAWARGSAVPAASAAAQLRVAPLPARRGSACRPARRNGSGPSTRMRRMPP